ncbi:hypothetical protein AB0D10_06235 [Kitasatospora sp. NPDC048545]|uniref:hypothetical protein n=1 Tax=unclassified Kitasatospora TaxID=2633591 RepID=UPI0033DC48A7
MTATHRPGHAPPPDRTTYRVTYTVFGEVRRDEVTVVPGYSREDDIPRILAARLAGRPSDRPGLRPGPPSERTQPERTPEVVVLDLREI